MMAQKNRTRRFLARWPTDEKHDVEIYRPLGQISVSVTFCLSTNYELSQFSVPCILTGLKAVEEFHTYVANNRGIIPNDGERYRSGERISTGFVESTVNQVMSKRFCKRQQGQWTKQGAHLLL
jgi:hypothetical protein